MFQGKRRNATLWKGFGTSTTNASEKQEVWRSKTELQLLKFYAFYFS